MKRVPYLRITTVPMSLSYLLEGQPQFLKENNFKVHLASSGSCPPDLSEFTFHSIPLSRTISPIKDIISIWRLKSVLKKNKIEIIHSHTPKAGLIAMISGALARTPIRLHTVAGLPQDHATRLTSLVLNVTEFITYLFSHKVYFNSITQMESQKTKFKLFENKFAVIHNGTSNGIDLSRFTRTANKSDLRIKLHLSRDLFYWIFIGRIHRHKGVIELIEAFNTFDKLNAGKSQLLIVGGLDDARTDLNYEWIQKIESENPTIKFLGFQSNVEEWLGASDTLVFPSYREGFPNVPLQAAVLGIPVLASEINGCNEIVSHEKNGFLFPTQDSNSILTAMQRVYEDPSLRKNMSDWSKANIPQKYDRTMFHEKLLAEYVRMHRDKIRDSSL
jgi:glycosyltransferase involved in cell wall biosynthesis